jgi:hypothetical protein
LITNTIRFYAPTLRRQRNYDDERFVTERVASRYVAVAAFTMGR